MGRTHSPSTGLASLWHGTIVVFLVVISVGRSRGKIACMKAPGKNAAGDTCEGDYCMFAELPGIDQPVRGCLSGDLLKSDIKNQCEWSEKEKKNVCICSTAGCNVNAKGINREAMETLKCYKCEKNCSAETFCYGEYCTFVKYPNGRIVRGCSSPSMPLFERKGLGSCVTPSFPTHTEQRHWDSSTLRAVTCTCNDRNFCNGPVLTKRIQAESTVKKCPVRAYATTKMGRHPSPSVPDCDGEHCFNILVRMGDVATNVSGCMSFLKPDKKGDKRLHEELNDRGCMTIDSETLWARACFDTESRPDDKDEEDNDEDANQDEPVTEMKDEAPSGSKNAEEGQSGDKSRKEGKARPQQSARNRTPKERPNTDGEAESPKKDSEPEAASEPAKPAHFIRADEDPENPVMKPESEGNTAIVAVFVAIMVLIVIAGVVWKFELHKKIFHARYQTVAGG